MSGHVLYLFVNTAMASMTPGRIAAQTAHAGNQISEIIADMVIEDEDVAYQKELFNEWKNQAYGFGTTIVLGYNGLSDDPRDKRHINLFDEDEVEFLKVIAEDNSCWHNLLVDPEYHLKDGDHVHLVKDVPTVFWVFVPINRLSDFKKQISGYRLL